MSYDLRLKIDGWGWSENRLNWKWLDGCYQKLGDFFESKGFDVDNLLSVLVKPGKDLRALQSVLVIDMAESSDNLFYSLIVVRQIK